MTFSVATKTTFLLLTFWALIKLVSANQPNSIFILAGQSNMAGRGGVVGKVWDHSIPFECMSSRSILRLNAKSTWEVAKEPLHVDIDYTKTCGVGPGMPFAHEVLKRDSSLGMIGLVPCAVGGTSMSRWARGEFLYNQMLMRVGASLKVGGEIRALQWYQGESDADEDTDGSFASDVRRFFTSVRDDLHLPTLPIIQVALPPGVKCKFTMEVRNSQLRLRLPFLSTVDAKGLKLKDDGLHLNTSEQVQLGKKMAIAYLQMTSH